MGEPTLAQLCVVFTHKIWVREFLSNCLNLRIPDAHHEVTEGTVDVLAAALQGGVIRGVDQVHGHVARL